METKKNILCFDLESAPLKAYTWGPIYETSLIKVIEHTKILSYSAKWLNGQHITKGLLNYKGYKKNNTNDFQIVKDIRDLFDRAEIIIVQNGKAFDIKLMNARFIFYGLKPPSPYKVVDTKTEAKKYIRLPSYSLDYMCDYFGIGKKQEHEGFPLWEKCIAGDSKAWKRMLKYNKHDVVITEQLYLKIRPYITNHPITSEDREKCQNCRGFLQKRGYAINKKGRYHRLQCMSCGAWFQGRKHETHQA